MHLPKVQKRFELQYKDNVEHKMSFVTEMSSSNTRSFISNANTLFQSAWANNKFKHCNGLKLNNSSISFKMQNCPVMNCPGRNPLRPRLTGTPEIHLLYVLNLCG